MKGILFSLIVILNFIILDLLLEYYFKLDYLIS